MRAVKDEFPNPILAVGRDDYVDGCSFIVDFDEKGITVGDEDIQIPINYSLVCGGLQTLINDGHALVVVNVKSSAASYSKLHRFPAGVTQIQISVPKYSVVTKMDIIGSVIAARNIEHFRCDEFNDLYFGGATFEIRKGDILAIEDGRTVYLDDTELEKPISSIFSISRYDDQDSNVVPSFEDEKIQICLKDELFKLYYIFKDFNNGVFRRYATGVIVYPVLVEAAGYVLKYHQNKDEGVNGDRDYAYETEYSNKRWFRAIEHKIESKGVKLENYEGCPTTLANDLLGDIAFDALKSFKDTLDEEMDSGETLMIGGVD